MDSDQAIGLVCLVPAGGLLLHAGRALMPDIRQHGLGAVTINRRAAGRALLGVALLAICGYCIFGTRHTITITVSGKDYSPPAYNSTADYDIDTTHHGSYSAAGSGMYDSMQVGQTYRCKVLAHDLQSCQPES